MMTSPKNDYSRHLERRLRETQEEIENIKKARRLSFVDLLILMTAVALGIWLGWF